MSNPLSHVGQTPHPELSPQIQHHCDQVQSQGQGLQSQDQTQELSDLQEAEQPAEAPWEPPATRLPQHPQQQQDDPLHRPADQRRIHQQGETRAEDTSLPAPTDAD